MPRLIWRMCFAIVLFFPFASAQQTVKFDSFCDYFSASPPVDLRLGNPEPRAQDLLSATLSRINGPATPKLYAANVRAFAAARRGDETFLLYNPRYFDSQMQSGRLSPQAVAILVHQIWHLSYKNGLTTEPGVRQQMELLADETSGSAMRSMGVSGIEAISPLAGLPDSQQSSLFPTVQQRREAILQGWMPQNSASASGEAEHHKGMAPPPPSSATGGGGPPASAHPPAAGDGHPKKARPPDRFGAPPDRYNPPPPPTSAAGGGSPRPGAASPDSAGSDQPATIPQFPWPPPEASAFARIPTSLLLARAPATPHLRDAAASLIGALSHAGYTETSFYSVPDGFALASRMEQMDADGRPLPGNSRWALSVAPESVFCLSCYLKALLTAGHPGHFRVVVFIVSSRAFAQANTPVTAKTAKDWLDSGMNMLPSAIGALPFTADHACTALIYEFELRQGDAAAALKLPGTLTGATHLVRAGIWPQLN